MTNALCGKKLEFGSWKQIKALQRVNELHDIMIKKCKKKCGINTYNDCKKLDMCICEDYLIFLKSINKLKNHQN